MDKQRIAELKDFYQQVAATIYFIIGVGNQVRLVMGEGEECDSVFNYADWAFNEGPPSPHFRFIPDSDSLLVDMGYQNGWSFPVQFYSPLGEISIAKGYCDGDKNISRKSQTDYLRTRLELVEVLPQTWCRYSPYNHGPLCAITKDPSGNSFVMPNCYGNGPTLAELTELWPMVKPDIELAKATAVEALQTLPKELRNPKLEPDHIMDAERAIKAQKASALSA